MKINNSLDVARWESLDCKCGEGVMNSYPVKECLHCKFDQAWKSVPKEDFTVNNNLIDKDGKVTKKQTKTVREVTLIRGQRFDDVVGWTWQ
tara:strand:- start:609 stop:881 length:273 start_codon:yes stop_codon:yes gene_type:complete